MRDFVESDRHRRTHPLVVRWDREVHDRRCRRGGGGRPDGARAPKAPHPVSSGPEHDQEPAGRSWWGCLTMLLIFAIPLAATIANELRG
jgi:hypothetical protein